MKKGILLSVVTTTTLLLAGCSSHTKDDHNINMSLPTEAKADKLDAQGYDAAMPVYSAVYDSLVQYDKKKGIKAGLADRWKVDNSGKEYEFHLKENVKFSDGSKLDAKAVKFSIERAKKMNKETTVETLKQLDQVVVKDSQTVQIKLK